MRNIAIIPARSGSKGLPDKNIRLLNGIPLLAYSIEEAQKSNLFTEIMVSTDSERYADIARKYGAKVPFLRSAETSTDTAGSWDAVKEVLHGYAEKGQNFDTICLLQPTSPLRKAEDIIGTYNLYKGKNADAVTSVCEVDHSPLWCMKLDNSLSLSEFRKNLLSAPRQQIPTFFRINGAIYIRRIEYGNENVIIVDSEEYAYIMPRERSVDIDCLMDFKLAENMFQEEIYDRKM